ncbi:hypothetical protein Gohar_022124 [Gossypium harknessii]|uniref:Uncharacterized protein n=1 Tax=Gossypium harknessii TaxID=34285 RepID=A0A7J9ICS9_9ROSI|nr:hypothetical protein [Gossypium harknessii]
MYILQGNSMQLEDSIKTSFSWAKHFISTHNEDLDASTQQSFKRPDSGRRVELFVTGNETRSWAIIAYWGSVQFRDKLFAGSKSTLLRRIQQILASERNGSLRYVLKEKKKIANAIAKMTLSNDETLHMFKETLMEIKEILDKASFLDNSTLNIPM